MVGEVPPPAPPLVLGTPQSAPPGVEKGGAVGTLARCTRPDVVVGLDEAKAVEVASRDDSTRRARGPGSAADAGRGPGLAEKARRRGTLATAGVR